MKKSASIAIPAIVLTIAGLLASPLAGATGHGGVNWSVTVGTPAPAVVYGPPAVYAPPVYASPVYVQPQPVYVEPRPVYVAPPAVVVPAPGVYYYGGYGPYYYGHHGWRAHHWHHR